MFQKNLKKKKKFHAAQIRRMAMLILPVVLSSGAIKHFQKLSGLWLAGEVVNRVGIYGSKAADDLSAFRRRSISKLLNK